MNQILNNNENYQNRTFAHKNFQESSLNGPDKINKISINAKRISSKIIYKILLFSSIILFVCFLSILFGKFYKNARNEQLSKKLTESYSISTLYSQNSDYTPIFIEETEPFVIGIIKIDKINLNYSILSMSNNDLLDISVCRFAGPMPNEVGNLCIAGHNYVDYKFFSRLNELQINDRISIFDLNGNKVDYKIYNKYEIKPSDTSCTFQDTDGLRVITLVTCNNVNGKRLVIHAKEIP